MQALRQTVPGGPIGEATPATFRIADVQVPNGTGGLRFATSAELVGLELTLTDVATGVVINVLDEVALLAGHGSYDETTGVLLLSLVAADNPIVTPASVPAGTVEWHRALIHMPDVLWVELDFAVQNCSGVG